MRPGLLVDLPEQVEQMRVHLDHSVLAPVAQELVERLEAVAVVNAIALVDDDGALVGVEIVEPERPLAGEAVAVGGDRQHKRRGTDLEPRLHPTGHRSRFMRGLLVAPPEQNFSRRSLPENTGHQATHCPSA